MTAIIPPFNNSDKKPTSTVKRLFVSPSLSVKYSLKYVEFAPLPINKVFDLIKSVITSSYKNVLVSAVISVPLPLEIL